VIALLPNQAPITVVLQTQLFSIELLGLIARQRHCKYSANGLALLQPLPCMGLANYVRQIALTLLRKM